VAQAPQWFGEIEPMHRGDLSWLISLPPDGNLPLGGACPTLLQWQSEPHPTVRLSERGCSILSLEVYHPEAAALEQVMQSIGLVDQVLFQVVDAPEKSGLLLRIQTPRGICVLSSQ
jgi:hypothetical protein